MENEYLNLLHLFHAKGVEYVMVGGYAVIAHGFPRTTGNLGNMHDQNKRL